MTGAEQAGANFVIGLRDLADRDASVAGTKAASLARPTALGLRVPEGFVITTAACDRILATAGNTAGARAGAGIPQDVWAEVRSHLDGLGDGAVAVRSSGTAEDLATASCAGQYETVLGVDGPEAAADAQRRGGSMARPQSSRAASSGRRCRRPPRPRRSGRWRTA